MSVPTLALDYDGAAQAVSLSRRELERLVACNEIPHCKHGSRVLFSVRELDRWLSERVAAQRGDRRFARRVKS
ncbi:MAG: helix-turn-helix domain-containing protein [Planctomycetes bacterium]|nr:helix-turn-helix domain-containing protein [Planctomycetota bacterium]